MKTSWLRHVWLALLALGLVPSVHASRLAGGQYRSALVMPDGTVWTWGSYLGRPAQQTGITEVVAVSARTHHTLALKSTGEVWGWGSAGAGQLGPGLGSTTGPVSIAWDAIAVAAGELHSVMLRNDGTVWSWGSNAAGQLGDGSTTDSALPVQAAGLSGVIGIAAGKSHTLAVTSDGLVWAWGANSYGQLGNGTTVGSAMPVLVEGLAGVVAVGAGHEHSLAVKSDSSVWAWGGNNGGQLGDGTAVTRTQPVPVTGLTDVVALASGAAHNLAVKSDGTIWVWGSNASSQLGDGTTTSRFTPRALTFPTAVIAVGAGVTHSVALTADGQVWAWGQNGYSEVGDGTQSTRSWPVQLSEAGYAWKVATPHFNPRTGSYTASQNVTVTCTTGGVSIHYTTDGSEPTQASATIAHGGVLTLSQTTTLKARAFRADLPPSNLAEETYTLRPAAPVMDPPAGSYTTPQNVVLTTITAGAEIRYTTNGSDVAATADLQG